MKLSLAYLTGMIDEIPPEAWADLFEAAGWPASLAQKRGAPKHEQIVTALTDDELSDELLEALEVLETLGTSAGREAIEAALADQHLLPDVLPANEGDRVYALRLFIGQRQDTALADVLARAQIEIQQRVSEAGPPMSFWARRPGGSPMPRRRPRLSYRPRWTSAANGSLATTSRSKRLRTMTSVSSASTAAITPSARSRS